MAYDNPIPGFQTNNTINLRLWAAKPDREFDLQAFNTGDYVQARILASTWQIVTGITGRLCVCNGFDLNLLLPALQEEGLVWSLAVMKLASFRAPGF